MTPTQIAAAVAALNAAVRMAVGLVEMLRNEELTPEQRAEIRAQHDDVAARIESLTAVPAPPG